MVCSKVTYATLAVTILVLALVQHSLSQNYHFSNGWYPGKKRSAATTSAANSDSGRRRGASASGALDEACGISPYALLLINRIVQDEVARLQKSCSPDLPSGFTEILENAANTLESDSKW
uniref:Gnrh n=1 Tax=Deroceras reticulatum TaxID=145610 RepID=A0A1X9WEE8_DERRE|nr:gnrh [Deroceras reticulatum]